MFEERRLMLVTAARIDLVNVTFCVDTFTSRAGAFSGDEFEEGHRRSVTDGLIESGFGSSSILYKTCLQAAG